jgi:hypothetical protein
MHRPGADPDRMGPEDFLCDFCGGHWAPDRPMVEGHRGSLICGPCLTVAYTALKLARDNSPPQPGETCVMCLAPKDSPHWRSPATPVHPLICEPCADQAARQLEKDKDSDWSRPRA